MAEDPGRPEHKPRLGRGLAALLGATQEDGDAPIARGARQAPIEFLKPNPRNPRKRFDDAELDELAASIKERGVIQPILVARYPARRGRLRDRRRRAPLAGRPARRPA